MAAPTDLALACDFRIGVDTAEMFMPAARFGLHYYRSGIERYVSRLGVDNAKRLFLTAQRITAPEMLRIGYLTAMVPEEALDEEVDKLANILAANAPVAMAGMKRAINEFARGKLDSAAADQRHRDSMRGDEIKEGVKALAEKRPPRVLSSLSIVMAGSTRPSTSFLLQPRTWMPGTSPGMTTLGTTATSRSLRPHRARLGELWISRKRLVALAVDGVECDAALGVGMNAPAKALAEA